MPTPRKVSRSLKRSATQLAKIPAESVYAAATDVVEYASTIGGNFNRGRSSLYAEARTRGGARSRVVTVFGRPAGYWSIRTYGRAGFRVTRTQRGTRRLKGFRVGSGYATATGPSRPARDGRWDQVVDYANVTVPDLIVDDVRAAFDG